MLEDHQEEILRERYSYLSYLMGTALNEISVERVLSEANRENFDMTINSLNLMIETLERI